MLILGEKLPLCGSNKAQKSLSRETREGSTKDVQTSTIENQVFDVGAMNANAASGDSGECFMVDEGEIAFGGPTAVDFIGVIEIVS